MVEDVGNIGDLIDQNDKIIAGQAETNSLLREIRDGIVAAPVVPAGASALEVATVEPVAAPLDRVVNLRGILDTARKYEGLHEVTNKADVQALLSRYGVNIDPAVVPWCAFFVYSILKEAGFECQKTGMSSFFLNYGEACEEQVGCIVCLAGHVGFVSRPGYVFGGNQSNMVNELKQSEWGTAKAFRRPTVDDLTSAA